MDLWSYTLKKLFFPRRIIIDVPGAILSSAHTIYSKKKINRRIVFIPEEFFVELFKKTRLELGKEKAADFLYSLGRDCAKLHIFLSGVSKPPKILLSLFIESIFKILLASGGTVATEVKFIKKNNRLVIKGSDNIICRKTSDPSFFLGGLSYLFGFCTGANIKAESFCKNCPNNCHILLSPGTRKAYSSFDRGFFNKDCFEETDLRKLKAFKGNYASFSDLIKHKKVIFKSGKYRLLNKTILLPFSPPILSLIYKSYLDKGIANIINSSILSLDCLFANHLLEEDYSKIKPFLSFLSSLGFGIPTILKRDNLLQLNLGYFPKTCFGVDFFAYLFNANLNRIYNLEYSYFRPLIYKERVSFFYRPK